MLANLRFSYRAWRYRCVLEPAQVRFLRKNLRSGDIAVDIGAHKGAYTYWMRCCVSPGGRVYAFEPQARLAQQLHARTATRAGRADVIVENLAVSSSTGRRALYIPGGADSPSAGLNQRSEATAATQSVVCDTLDSYFDRAGVHDIRLIKCDVEGHELDVFRGGAQRLRRDRPFLVFECEGRHRPEGRIDTVFAYLRDLGYTGWFHDTRRWRSVEEFDPARFQQAGKRPYINNFVFIHPAQADPQACL